MPPKIFSKDSTYVPPLLKNQAKAPNTSKRIRVSRACDNCRRRKVKCDGKQPCIHCTVYSYECVYNHVRSPAGPNKKVKRDTEAVIPVAVPSSSASTSKESVSEQLISAIFPEINTDDPNFNSELFLQIFENHRHNGVVDLKTILKEYKAIGGSHPKLNSRSIDPIEIKIILPPRDIALKLIYRTWNDACVLFRFYHRPSFLRDFNSLYEVNPNNYSNHQNKMLPLIYSVIAVGALFSKGHNAIDNQYLQDEGYKYFIAARKLIDITNSTDLESIQTIFMLTLFLQCSARLSTCYSYIGIALRSALRQGLHRKLETPCNYIKAECKKRLFWTIFKMEIYVNSMLGLPNLIDEAYINAEFPLDVDDQNIEYEVIHPQQQGKLSSCGINNSHTKLVLILNHIVKQLYKSSDPLFTISPDIIKNLENELKIWLYELPAQLRPDAKCSPEYLKANKLLYLDYLHVQIMLYRPFIHYVKIAKQESPQNPTALQSFHFENGMKCFEISKKIIDLGGDMIYQKLLNGSYWFSIYTIFFSVACLIYFFLEINQENEEINKAIEKGKSILLTLKQRSVSAERIYNLLNNMFENYDRTSIKIEALDKTKADVSNPLISPKLRPTPEQQALIQAQMRQSESPLQASSSLQSSFPLNSFTTPNNNSLISFPATHTVDSINDPPTASTLPQTNATTHPESNGVSFDEFDLKIFGDFLPAAMIPSKKIDPSDFNQIYSNNERPLGISASTLNSTRDFNINTLNQVGPPQTIQEFSNTDTSSGNSVKTEDEDIVFDWERFFDKNDDLNFEI